MTLLLGLLIAPTLIPLFGTVDFQTRELPPAQALQKYILDYDYPELFQGKHYRVRLDNVLSADIDNDGKAENIAHFHPHFRQSPTIVIYEVSSEMTITRVTEGLAPGPLQGISGEYLDSHELGEAVDLSVGKDSSAQDAALGALIGSFGGVVAYRGFFHADGRKGPAYYIDMRHVELPQETDTCARFEFSRVRQIAVGHLREDSSRNYLAAWVGDEIYVYLITGISRQGLLDKVVSVVKVPADFGGFIPGHGLAYETANGPVLLALQ